MDIADGLLHGFYVALQPTNVLWCFVGCLLGTVVGILPGLGPAATISLLLPLTFSMDPAGGVIMMAGIYYGAKYGGSTTSILLNIPGESSSVATCLDGYQMARKGRAGAALGIAAVASFAIATPASAQSRLRVRSIDTSTMIAELAVVASCTWTPSS